MLRVLNKYLGVQTVELPVHIGSPEPVKGSAVSAFPFCLSCLSLPVDFSCLAGARILYSLHVSFLCFSTLKLSVKTRAPEVTHRQAH